MASRSLHLEIKQLAALHIPLKMVIYFHGAYPGRGSCKEDISDLQCKETANIRNYFIHGPNHFGGMALLYRFTIDIEAKPDILYVSEFRFRDEPSDRGRIVETLRDLPRQSVFFLLSLQVTGGKIDSHCYLVVVPVSKPLRDIFSKAVDLDHQLGLVMHLFREIGQEKGLSVLQQGRIGFHEKHGVFVFHQPLHLSIMGRVVKSDGKNFHAFNRLNMTAR